MSFAIVGTRKEVEIMKKSGNEVANSVLEAKLWESLRMSETETVSSAEDFITKKYRSCSYFSEKAYWEFMDAAYPNHATYHNNTLIRGSVIALFKDASLQWTSSVHCQKEGNEELAKSPPPSFETDQTKKGTEEIDSQSIEKKSATVAKSTENKNIPLSLRRMDTPAEGCVASWRAKSHSLKETVGPSSFSTSHSPSVTNCLSSTPAPLIDMYMSDSEDEDEDDEQLVVFPSRSELEGFVGRDDGTKDREDRTCSSCDDHLIHRSNSCNDASHAKSIEYDDETTRHEKRIATPSQLCGSRRRNSKSRSPSPKHSRDASANALEGRHRNGRRSRSYERSASQKYPQESRGHRRRSTMCVIVVDNATQDWSTTENRKPRRLSSISFEILEDVTPHKPLRRSSGVDTNSFVVVGCTVNDSDYWEKMVDQWAALG